MGTTAQQRSWLLGMSSLPMRICHIAALYDEAIAPKQLHPKHGKAMTPSAGTWQRSWLAL
jgi:hypothetical protein